MALLLATFARASAAPTATLLVAGLEGGSGSTVGPGGALFVTESLAGRISRVDPQTGDITTIASGLPTRILGFGGAVDVAFIGDTAYALVTLVGFDGSADVGIYRVDGPNAFTVVANVGEFSRLNPPDTAFSVATGVQYAIETFRGGFLVTDGHHNRMLWVTLEGGITELLAFENIAPTGLAVSGNTIFMAEAGPVPHLPENGKIVAFDPTARTVTVVAAGAPLLVDVEFGRGRRLYGLSQGDFLAGLPPGSPALPDTGALVEVNADGTFTTIVSGLDRPTSLEFIGNTAYIVTRTGEIWKIDDVSGPPFGKSH